MSVEEKTPGMKAAESRLRRALLITPGDNEALVAKAAKSPTDAAIVEWEDGVFESRKQAARDVTCRAFREMDWRHREKVVRINPLDTPHAAIDIEAAVAGGVDAIMLPKVYTAEDVRTASGMIASAEIASGRPQSSVLLWAMIETALGLLNVDQIASADPRMSAIMFGGGDLGADLRVKKINLGQGRPLGPIRYEYLYGYSRVIAAARAYGIDPVIMGYTTFTDLEGTRLDAEFSAQMGFTGGLALSIRQLEVIRAAFSPSEADLKWSDDILGSFQDANDNDTTVIVVDKEMADGPYVRCARHLRTLQNKIDARVAIYGEEAA